ncbi:TonB-dependent receptor, partial [Burkholderia pseudomallei]
SGASSASPARPASAPPLAPGVVTARRGPPRLADAIPQTTLFDAGDIAASSDTGLQVLEALADVAQNVGNCRQAESS